jgi:hypothetical protein
MNRWKCCVVIGVAAILWTHCPLNAQRLPNSRDNKPTGALLSGDRTAFVISTLQARDVTLSKFTCELIEDDSAIDGETGATNQLAHKQFILKRAGDSTALTATLADASGPGAHWTVGWDGARERSLMTFPDGSQRGSIRDSQLPLLQQIGFLQILGLRARDQNVTLPRWLASLQFDANYRITTSPDAGPDATMLILDVSDDTTVQRFWIDPAKGGMIVKASFALPQFSENQIVEDSAKFGDLWVPTKVTCHRENREGKGPQLLQSFIVTHFNHETVADDAARVDFPPGVHVVDFVRHVAFTLDPQGREHPLPVYDPADGTVSMDNAGAETATRPTTTTSPADVSETNKVDQNDAMAMGKVLTAGGAEESIWGDWIRAFWVVAVLSLLVMGARLSNSWRRQRRRYRRRH